MSFSYCSIRRKSRRCRRKFSLSLVFANQISRKKIPVKGFLQTHKYSANNAVLVASCSVTIMHTMRSDGRIGVAFKTHIRRIMVRDSQGHQRSKRHRQSDSFADARMRNRPRASLALTKKGVRDDTMVCSLCFINQAKPNKPPRPPLCQVRNKGSVVPSFYTIDFAS